MRVIVLGAGVIGVTTAYYLAKAGHQVTVVERRNGPALEASYANAGEISPGYAAPWASPQVPFKALKWLLTKHSPLIIRPHLDAKMLLWILQMLQNCTSSRYEINKSRMVRLAEYSRDCLIALRTATPIDYDGRSKGTLQLFRERSQLDGAAADIEVLRKQGVPFELLDVDGCINAEPALARVRDKIAGGLRMPHDETGDCFKFTSALAKLAVGEGVDFKFEQSFLGFQTAGQDIQAVQTNSGSLEADCFVMALGSFSPVACSKLGITLPVYPVKGYSLTISIDDENASPESTIMDERYKIAITRLGSRVRVGGMAEISGYSTDLPAARRATLAQSVNSLFPGCGDIAAASFWSGLRPMTPDGTPVVGPTPYKNLWLNTGHGTLGWTMACGSAKLIADQISNRPADIDTTDFAITRYNSKRR